MARKRQSIGGLYWYVPPVEGEDKTDPDAFRLLVSPFTGADVEQLKISLLDLINKDRIDQAKESIEARNAVIRERVKEVRGYELTRPDGTTFAPSNGEELIEAAYASNDHELLEIIAEDLWSFSKLKENIWEPSRSQSEPVSQETSKSGPGVASDASGPTGPEPITTTPPSESNATATASPTPDS